MHPLYVSVVYWISVMGEDHCGQESRPVYEAVVDGKTNMYGKFGEIKEWSNPVFQGCG